MLIEPVAVVISLLIGTILGLGYFAGLWVTVQALPTARRPQLLWAGSALLRAAAATLVFVILLRWGTTQAVAGLAGFTIARFGATALWGRVREPKMPAPRPEERTGE